MEFFMWVIATLFVVSVICTDLIPLLVIFFVIYGIGFVAFSSKVETTSETATTAVSTLITTRPKLENSQNKKESNLSQDNIQIKNLEKELADQKLAFSQLKTEIHAQKVLLQQKQDWQY